MIAEGETLRVRRARGQLPGFEIEEVCRVALVVARHVYAGGHLGMLVFAASARACTTGRRRGGIPRMRAVARTIEPSRRPAGQIDDRFAVGYSQMPSGAAM